MLNEERALLRTQSSLLNHCADALADYQRAYTDEGPASARATRARRRYDLLNAALTQFEQAQRLYAADDEEGGPLC